VAAIGFSTSTSRPASSARRATSKCATAETATIAASASANSSSCAATAGTPSSRPIARALEVSIGDPDQLDVVLLMRAIAHLARVMPAHHSGADHRDPQRAHAERSEATATIAMP